MSQFSPNRSFKVVSFNANGIRSAAQKGFFEWLNQEDPDVVCIQETKANLHQLQANPIFFPSGYHCYYVDAVKKGYSGVALFSKIKPSSVITSMQFPIADEEGRYLQCDYPNLSIVSLYLPSGTSGEHRQNIKFEFLNDLNRHFEHLKTSNRALIICGDYNIAHKIIDIKNWRGNQKNSGFLPAERAWMDALLQPDQFVDAFRVKNQNSDEYTWWSNRGQARAKNVGWRIDYQMITPNLRDTVAAVRIYRDIRFSDHAPLIVEYTGELCA